MRRKLNQHGSYRISTRVQGQEQGERHELHELHGGMENKREERKRSLSLAVGSSFSYLVLQMNVLGTSIRVCQRGLPIHEYI